MSGTRDTNTFHLQKWYLDIITDEGDCMIFYAATLKWHQWKVNYTSWLHDPVGGTVILKQGFRHVQLPHTDGEQLTWTHEKFGVSGTWKSKAKGIEARLVDQTEGYLDWHCHQPVSDVSLFINGRRVHGRGYAEELIMTIPAWKIAMHELRWGRFIGADHHLVWIEIRHDEVRKWLWWNGELQQQVGIGDDAVAIEDKSIYLQLEKDRTMESEKKIGAVTRQLVRFLPGFQKGMTTNFLMADSSKWKSRGELSLNGIDCDHGDVIHEFVNFQPR